MTAVEAVSYERVYVPGEKFEIKNVGEKFSGLAIPIDPVSLSSAIPRAFVKMLHVMSYLISKLILILEIGGILVSGMAAYTNPDLKYKLILIIITSFAIFDIVRRIVTSRAVRKEIPKFL